MVTAESPPARRSRHRGSRVRSYLPNDLPEARPEPSDEKTWGRREKTSFACTAIRACCGGTIHPSERVRCRSQGSAQEAEPAVEWARRRRVKGDPSDVAFSPIYFAGR